MIFQCNDLERALRSPELMPDARAHAETCERCRYELYLWGEISSLAPQLHREWDSPALWPRIRAELEAAAPKRKVVPIFWRWGMAVAAVLVIGVVLLRPWAAHPTGAGRFLSDDALREVQQAETAYARSIDRLAKVAGATLEQSPTPLAAVYRDKLLTLDSAIADIKANLETNRYNVYLQNQLASLYREKQKTLEDWLQNANRN
jgi:hypothetical protein